MLVAELQEALQVAQAEAPVAGPPEARLAVPVAEVQVALVAAEGEAVVDRAADREGVELSMRQALSRAFPDTGRTAHGLPFPYRTASACCRQARSLPS